MKKETKRKLLTFVVAIALPLIIGGFSAFLTKDNMSMYEEVVPRLCHLLLFFFPLCGQFFMF